MNEKYNLITPENIQGELIKNEIELNNLKVQAFKEQKYNELLRENQQLKEQLEYLRSGEYLNQLKFENKLLEDIMQFDELSKEDKEFIDMTHRNTELLEENQKLKDRIEKAIEYIEQLGHSEWASFGRMILLEILKEDNKEE